MPTLSIAEFSDDLRVRKPTQHGWLSTWFGSRLSDQSYMLRHLGKQEDVGDPPRPALDRTAPQTFRSDATLQVRGRGGSPLGGSPFQEEPSLPGVPDDPV